MLHALLVHLALAQPAPVPLADCAMQLARAAPERAEALELVAHDWRSAEAQKLVPAPPPADPLERLEQKVKRDDGFVHFLDMVAFCDAALDARQPVRAAKMLEQFDREADADAHDRWSYLGDSARLHARLGERELAQQRLHALEAQLPKLYDFQQGTALASLAAAYLALGDDAKVKSEVAAMLASARARGGHDGAGDLVTEARGLARLGHGELGLALAAGNPGDVRDHDGILRAALEGALAKKQLELCGKLVAAMNVPEAQVAAYRELAEKDPRGGWLEAAAAVARQAPHLEDVRDEDVVELFARAERPAEAEPFLARIHDPLVRAHTQAALAEAYANAGTTRRAQELAREALGYAREVSTNGDRMLIADRALSALYLTGAVEEADKLELPDPVEPELRERSAVLGLARSGQAAASAKRWRPLPPLQRLQVLSIVATEAPYAAARDAFAKVCAEK